MHITQLRVTSAVKQESEKELIEELDQHQEEMGEKSDKMKKLMDDHYA